MLVKCLNPCRSHFIARHYSTSTQALDCTENAIKNSTVELSQRLFFHFTFTPNRTTVSYNSNSLSILMYTLYTHVLPVYPVYTVYPYIPCMYPASPVYPCIPMNCL